MSWYIKAEDLYTYHCPSPGGGGGGGWTPGRYNFIWGFNGRFKRLFHPGGGGNEGGLVFKSLTPQGKQGTL